jgi:uncharacterized membrane protein YphA (DoxX/SURF4 family)
VKPTVGSTHSADFTKKRWWGLVCLILRVGLGGIFVFASLDKILDPVTFTDVVMNYKVLPNSVVPTFSVVLPWLEFITGMLLIIGYAVESASVVIALMLIAFIFGITVNLFRGVEMACGCFGFLEGGHKIGWHTVLRDVAMLLCALVLVIAYNPFASIEALFSKLRQERGDER